MNSMDVNKAVAAVLVAGIAFMVTGFIADGLVVSENPAKPAIKIEVAQASSGPAAAPEGPGPILGLLASADVKAGEAEVQHVCAACHTYNEGGKTLVGPNLYGVVGRKQASEPGFDYSAGLKAHTGTWTYQQLNHWLWKPAAYAPGTRMAFVGIPSDKKRADVIAFLRTLSKSPVPLPTAAEIAAEAPKPAAAAAKTAAAPAAAASAAPSFESLVAKADVKKGASIVQGVCAACHTLDKGGKTLVGPNLWDIVDRKQGAEPGFSYSDAFKAKMKGTWTYDALNTWLTAPMKEVPGTRMAFAGISSEQQRADAVAYLRTLADKPAPLKTAAAAAPAAPAQTAAAAPAPAPATQDAFAALVAKADVKKGQTIAQGVCAACHTLNKGGPTIVGPNLWDVVDRKQGAEPGFSYSDAFKAKMKGAWTYDALNTWLKAPMKEVPGTRMAFAGISSEQQRADLVAYLRTLADKPAPLPK